ncbi:hypothetical protein CFU_0230 [Collimonas fungivorans Ter331]|uniref:Uncharacterized protein n=1 Tax=Collimonas fungivorans (strain Ter331) TaxID=1005048 RepID=G0AHM9_COLFT|nr:hypothetical protein CFU_0230 [Collimonas fungivorans Ter331]
MSGIFNICGGKFNAADPFCNEVVNPRANNGENKTND